MPDVTATGGAPDFRRYLELIQSDSTAVVMNGAAEPAESHGGTVPERVHWSPQTHADAKDFKFSVNTSDGMRELVPEANGEWLSKPTTREAFYQDPRPMAHLKSEMYDADMHTLIRLPGQTPDAQEWYIVPDSRTLCAPPQMPMRLISLAGDSDPFGHHLIGTFNFDRSSFPNNEETVPWSENSHGILGQ